MEVGKALGSKRVIIGLVRQPWEPLLIPLAANSETLSNVRNPGIAGVWTASGILACSLGVACAAPNELYRLTTSHGWRVAYLHVVLPCDLNNLAISERQWSNIRQE